MSLLDTIANILNAAGVHIHLVTSLQLFGLIFTRVATSFMLVPFLGGPTVPGQIKVGLSVAVAAVLFPSLTQSANIVRVSAIVYLALLAKEAIVGAIIGFIAQVVFYGIQVAGILIDTQRGMNQITYLAPQLPGHVSTLGNFKFQASIVLFLAIGGHLLFLRALAGSFTVLPILAMPHLRAGSLTLADSIARISGSAIVIGLQLSAPIILAIFLVDVSFGCIGKVASQIRTSHDSNTVKAWVGLALFFLSAAFLFALLPGLFEATIHAISQFTKSLA